MIRYRWARTVPGAKPPPSSDGEEPRRPTGLSDAPRRRAASATDGVARPVGSCDREPAGAPQAGQKRLASRNSAEHEEQRIVFSWKPGECYFTDAGAPFVVVGAFSELMPVFSPDTRFVAYQSNESGRPEIYVQSFPVASGKWQVSTSGGNDPSWRADGKELYYRSADQKLMAVDIQAGESFKAGIPRSLFPARVQPGISRNKYVVSGTGERFLFVAPLGREALTPTTVVLNWSAEFGR